jgi:hypothetical protein
MKNAPQYTLPASHLKCHGSPERPQDALQRNGRYSLRRAKRRTEQRGHLLDCLRHLKTAVEKDGFDFAQLVADI